MSAAWQKTTPGESKSATEPLRERRIAEVGRRQLRLITTGQLLEIGLGATAIAKRAQRGALHRLHSGGYATHPPPYSRHQRWLAAVLACGPGALLSDLASAALQGFTDDDSSLAHVSVPSGRGRSREGIVVHRLGPIDPRDVRRVDSIPCTSTDLTLVELAASLDEFQLETMLVAAESLQIVKRGRLAELVAERPGRPGIHRLAALHTLEPQLIRSKLGLLFLPVWRAAGLERPRVSFAIRVEGRRKPLKADFAWPAIRMVVEADSQRFHGDWERAEIDRDRDQLLALAGWLCHRFVRRRIAGDPEGSAERLRALAAARVAERARVPRGRGLRQGSASRARRGSRE